MKPTTRTAVISRTDYEPQLSAFVADEKAQLAKKPAGFFANWAFYAAKKTEFLQGSYNDQQSVQSEKAGHPDIHDC